MYDFAKLINTTKRLEKTSVIHNKKNLFSCISLCMKELKT